jgi:hypothetical protein
MPEQILTILETPDWICWADLHGWEFFLGQPLVPISQPANK